ncbi:hypothetical protein OAR00_01445 [Alphaproteobacteria bacterium]|nr:hypothetical protein [Alphaproteobacteria bacterium]MDC1023198.1 hypothetical protein [Alphaproteobacteria bacterium]
MIKNISILLVITFMALGSGCSTYNSIVPDWASIGLSSSEVKTSETKNENGLWWNPFSWF